MEGFGKSPFILVSLNKSASGTSLIVQDSAAKQMYEGVKSKCASAPDAWAWGNKWDMSAWASSGETTVITKEVIIENVM